MNYDSAIITLQHPMPTPSFPIKPIRLATPNQDYLEKPGRLATVAGWGNTIKQEPGHYSGGNYPNRMREARVPLVSDAKAKDVYGESYIPSLMVAAGREGKDTCDGDSGGPMFARDDGTYTQIGITSYGAGCGARGYPGVYTEVNAAPIRSFITDAAGR